MLRKLSRFIADAVDNWIVWPIETAVRWMYKKLLAPFGRFLAALLTGPIDFLAGPARQAATWVYGRALAPVGRVLGLVLSWPLAFAAGVVEERGGRTVAPAALTVFVCLAVMAGYFIRDVHHLRSPEALELAQTARNLSRGRGLTTSAIRPLSLVFHADTDRHPDFVSSPLQSLVTASAFIIHRPSDRVAALASGVFLLPTLWLIFAIGRRLRGVAVGAVAAIAYVSAPAVLQDAFSGTAAQLSAFLFTLWIYLCLCRPATKSAGSVDEYRAPDWPWQRLVWVGVVFGLLTLADWHFTWLWLVALGFVFVWASARPSVRSVVFFLIGLLLVTSPWLTRNYRLAGSPTFSLRSFMALSGTPRHPGTSLLRTVSPPSTSSAKLTQRNARAMGLKVLLRVAQIRDSFPRWLDPYLFVLFMAALLAYSTDVAALGLKTPLIVFLLLRAALGHVFEAPAGTFTAFAPLAVVLGCDVLLNRLTGRAPDRDGVLRRRRTLATVGLPALVLLLAGVPTLVAICVGRDNPNPNAGLAELSTAFGPDDLLVSDAPWSVAWYANRKAIWAPQSTDDLAIIEQQVGPVAGLVLTPGATAFGNERLPNSVRWSALYREPRFYAGYRPQGRLPGGTVVYRRMPLASGNAP